MKFFSFFKRKSSLEFTVPTLFELLANTALMLQGLTLREPFSTNDDYKYFIRQAIKDINAVLGMYKIDPNRE